MSAHSRAEDIFASSSLREECVVLLNPDRELPMASSPRKEFQIDRRFRLCRALAAALCILVAQDVGAGHFERVFASENGAKLAEWGRRYEQGQSVRPDMNRAIRLYCKAAKKGRTDAQYQLGWIYAHGRGVKRDDALAAAWFGKAAKQNHRQSQNMLKLVRATKKKRATCPLRPTARIASRPHAAKAQVTRLVLDLAPGYSLDPELVLAVIEAESNYNPNARSPKNAQGLMQLIPETAKRFGVLDVWDPEQNLRGGMAYLRWLLNHFEGNVKLALAGYNAGESAVVRYRGIPPYDETQAYVSRIARRLNL